MYNQQCVNRLVYNSYYKLTKEWNCEQKKHDKMKKRDKKKPTLQICKVGLVKSGMMMRGMCRFLILPDMHQIHFKILAVLLTQSLKDDAGK